VQFAGDALAFLLLGEQDLPGQFGTGLFSELADGDVGEDHAHAAHAGLQRIAR